MRSLTPPASVRSKIYSPFFVLCSYGLYLKICCWCVADFHRREDDLKNDPKNTKERVLSLEVNLREAEAGADELKRMMETSDSEFVVTQKLAYEKQTR
jgi:hypothetical protein